MTDLEQRIREAEAGPWLRIMCSVALGYTADTILRDIAAAGPQAASWPLPNVPEEWSAAGQAFQWLNVALVRFASLGPWVAERHGQMHTVTVSRAESTKHLIVRAMARDPRLAIARAVCLVGLQERPDEMTAAAEALEVPHD